MDFWRSFSVQTRSMQKFGEKLIQAGVIKPPQRTTFSDGRLSLTEAHIYYESLCRRAGAVPVTRSVFRWYVKQGSYIRADLVPNVFGPYPPKIWAITKEAVQDFIVELAKRDLAQKTSSIRIPEELRGSHPHALEVTDLDLDVRGKQVRQPTSKAQQGVKVAVLNPSPIAVPHPQEIVKDVQRLTTSVGVGVRKRTALPQEPEMWGREEALQYLQKCGTHAQDMTSTTLGLYFAYEVIDSVLTKHGRRTTKENLDTYLELFPTGVYAHHLSFDTREVWGKDDLTVDQAYAYYRSKDPQPLTDISFRVLLNVGILLGIRKEDSPQSKLLGVTRTEVDRFVKERMRLAEAKKSHHNARAHKTLSSRRRVSPQPPVQVEPVSKPSRPVDPNMTLLQITEAILGCSAQEIDGRVVFSPDILERAQKVQAQLGKVSPTTKKTLHWAWNLIQQAGVQVELRHTHRDKKRIRVRTLSYSPPNGSSQVGNLSAASNGGSLILRGGGAPVKQVATQPVVATSKSMKAAGREWASVKDAYQYYVRLVDQPYTAAWFQKQIYQGTIESKLVDGGTLHLHDQTRRVNLDSVDQLVQLSPEDNTNFPADQAYYHFKDVIPSGVSFIGFSRLVRAGEIKSFLRDSVVRVHRRDVVEYFSRGNR